MNPPIFQLAALRASLELFSAVGIDKLRHKSVLLTQFARELVNTCLANKVEIITPTSEAEHGSQISLRVLDIDNSKIVTTLTERNIICDFRPPNVIRAAFIPFYNSFMDVYKFIEALCELT